VNIACHATVDVLKEGTADLLSGVPSVSPYQFGLEGFEEGFDGSIIVAVSFAARWYFETQFMQPLLIVVGTVLTASIRMMNAALWRVAKGYGIVQSLQGQITFQPIADGPADHPA
jgi:hypothetical protein